PPDLPSSPTRRSSDLRPFPPFRRRLGDQRDVDMAIRQRAGEIVDVTLQPAVAVQREDRPRDQRDFHRCTSSMYSASIRATTAARSEEHTSELQSPYDL